MAADAGSAPPEPAGAAFPPSPSPEPQKPPKPPGMIAQVQNLMRELPGLFSDRVDLFVLELQRASQALAQIVVLVVVTAIVAATAWFAFWGGVVAVLVSMAGLSMPLALLAVLVVNLLAAVFAVVRLRSLLPLLSMPATRRHLSFGPPPYPAPAPAPDSETPPDPARDHAKSP